MDGHLVDVLSLVVGVVSVEYDLRVGLPSFLLGWCYSCTVTFFRLGFGELWNGDIWFATEHFRLLSMAFQLLLSLHSFEIFWPHCLRFRDSQCVLRGPDEWRSAGLFIHLRMIPVHIELFGLPAIIKEAKFGNMRRNFWLWR